MNGPVSPLAGLRVVDFTQALSGPYGTLMLADLGAEVIKVETPGRGDDSRHWGPPMLGDDAAYFMSVNRNKLSTTIDLKDPEGLATALELVRTADVVIENWRPGTAARLGVGPDDLTAIKPDLIYCSISGYGQGQGTLSGYDQIVQGTSGVMSLTGRPGEPTKWGVPVGDIAAGMFAATAILAALHARTASGEGAVIDIAMQDCLVSMLSHHAARYLTTGVTPATEHNGHATIAPYGMFASSDGNIDVCVGNDSQFQRMCSALGRDDLAEDARYGTNPLRVANKADLMAETARTLASMTTEEAMAALVAVGVPVGPVRTVGEVLDDPATHEREMVLTFNRDDVTDGRVVNTPWKFDGRAPSVRLAPPHLGEHNDLLTALPVVQH